MFVCVYLAQRKRYTHASSQGNSLAAHYHQTRLPETTALCASLEICQSGSWHLQCTALGGRKSSVSLDVSLPETSFRCFRHSRQTCRASTSTGIVNFPFLHCSRQESSTVTSFSLMKGALSTNREFKNRHECLLFKC